MSRDYPHTLLDSMNKVWEETHNIRPFTMEEHSLICRQYNEVLREGCPEREAQQELEELISNEIALTAIKAYFTRQELIMLREAGCRPLGPECDSFYDDLDKKQELKARGIPETLTCKHGTEAEQERNALSGSGKVVGSMSIGTPESDATKPFHG